jgi:pyrroline-5-carboxylate reductase
MKSRNLTGARGEVVAVIGAGVIGGAIAKSLLRGKRRKVVATRRVVKNARELEALGIKVLSDNRKAARDADIVFLCVKPGDVARVLKEMSDEVKGKLVISTAATVPLGFYAKLVPKARFVRAMPNVAVLVQEAFTGYCCDGDVTPEDRKKVQEILNALGRSEEVEEKYMDAITALSGSAPGYLSVIMEGLMYAGLRVGLPRELALTSSAQAVLGTAKLVLETKEHPAKIKDMVTTPGGTTIEAIFELEGSQIRQALMRAVKEATDKSQVIRDQLDIG